jgi:hypothetical protein
LPPRTDDPVDRENEKVSANTEQDAPTVVAESAAASAALALVEKANEKGDIKQNSAEHTATDRSVKVEDGEEKFDDVAL